MFLSGSCLVARVNADFFAGIEFQSLVENPLRVFWRLRLLKLPFKLF